MVDKLSKFLKSNSNRRSLIYLDKNSTIKIDRGLNDSFDVILSPYYYWIKKESIPLRFEFQVQKIAQSIFSGELHSGEYEYRVTKVDKDSYFIIAYDKIKILDALKELDYKINRVYFAQSEFMDLDEVLEVTKSSAIVKVDDIVQSLPLSLVERDSKLLFDYLKEINLSNKSVDISLNSFTISNSDFFKLSIPLSITFAILVANYFMIQNSIKDVEASQDALSTKYSLPVTSFQINNLISKLNRIDKESKSLKNTLLVIGKISLQKGEYISLLDLKNGNLELVVSLSRDKRAEIIKKHLLSNGVDVVSMQVDNKELKVKIKV